MFLVPRINIGASAGLLCQLGAVAPAGTIQRHEYMVRKHSSDVSGAAPGVAVNMRQHFFFTDVAGMFKPPAAGTQLERAAMHVDQLAPLQGEPAREVVFSGAPQPRRGATLLRMLGLHPSVSFLDTSNVTSKRTNPRCSNRYLPRQDFLLPRGFHKGWTRIGFRI